MNIFNQSTLNIKYIFDKKKLKRGDYSSQYFLKTKQILNNEKPKISILQFSILDDGEFVIAGISECVSLLKTILSKKVFNSLKIYGRKDGDVVHGKTGILYIEGQYKDICLFENVIDGILNKRIGIATKAYELTKYIKPNQKIIYMADRTEDYWSQNGNGLAAYIGGIKLFSTEKNIEYIKQINKEIQAVGTMPHALIQQFDGNLFDACNAYIKSFPNQNLIALLDYRNDVIGALEQLKPILKNIYGVRLDTSKCLIDKSLENDSVNIGVNPNLVSLVRSWLDKNNFNNIKIIVSSGINGNKIQLFNQQIYVPDIFGVGGDFLNKTLNVTADLISLNGKIQSKVGRYCFVDYKNELFLYKI